MVLDYAETWVIWVQGWSGLWVRVLGGILGWGKGGARGVGGFVGVDVWGVSVAEEGAFMGMDAGVGGSGVGWKGVEGWEVRWVTVSVEKGGGGGILRAGVGGLWVWFMVFLLGSGHGLDGSGSLLALIVYRSS